MARLAPLALLVVFLAPLAPSLAPDAPGGGADAEKWSARLKDLQASYGQETWKYDLDYEGQASPATVVAHLQNQSSSYAGAVGLRATLEVEICKFDECSTGTLATQATRDYNVTAVIPTTRGDLYAYVRRTAAESNTFFLDFDLDGANNGDPAGRVPPAADPGLQEVQVAINRRYVDPTQPAAKVGDATLQFTYELPFFFPNVPAYAGLRHVQEVPDSVFRLYNDIGWDRSVSLITRALSGDMNLTVDYEFTSGAAGQTVELWAFVAKRGVQVGGSSQPSPAPPIPFIPGVSDNETLQNLLDNTDRLVLIDDEKLADGTVDVTGHVAFTVTAGQLLSAGEPDPQAALVVVAPLLVSNFVPAQCTGDCKGGPQYRVGAAELVAPVSGRTAVIDGYKLVDSGMTGGSAPQPVRDIALGVNALQVFVRDPEGFSPPQDPRSGDLYALVADARSSEPLSGGSLSVSQREPETGGRFYLLQGNLGVRSIQSQHVSHYRVFAFLYGSNDAFHTVTWGDRGYTVTLDAPEVEVPPGDGGVAITLTSQTTNYNAIDEESFFDIQVVYQVTIPEFNIQNLTNSVTLKEAASFTEFVPLKSDVAASATISVSSTSGDVLPLPARTVALWVEAEEDESLADRIPGFDAALLASALGVAGLVWRSRRPE